MIMQVLTFLGSRRFRWPLAIALGVAGLAVLVATRGESGLPFGLMMLAAFVAYDG